MICIFIFFNNILTENRLSKRIKDNLTTKSENFEKNY